MRSRPGAVFLRIIYGFLDMRVTDLAVGVTAVGGPFAHFPFGVVTIFWCLCRRLVSRSVAVGGLSRGVVLCHLAL